MADIGRHLHGTVGRDIALGRIAAERKHRRDTVADLEIGNAGADRNHVARAFIAGDERMAAGRRIGAGAKVSVDVVDAGRGLLDADLTRSRGGKLDVLESQNLRTAGLVNPNRRYHGNLPFLVLRTVKPARLNDLRRSRRPGS